MEVDQNSLASKGVPLKIYLAGPLFSTAEQEFNSRLKQHLIAYGHEVWLPQDESDEQTGEKAATEIFTLRGSTGPT